jgi:uncharacterized protein (DUF1330 family)
MTDPTPTPSAKAYVVNQVEIHDMATYQEYVAIAVPAIAAHGGRILASGGRVETMEGEPVPPRVVIIEFPDWASAESYYRSATYQQAREARGDAATVRFALVEGRPGI